MRVAIRPLAAFLVLAFGLAWLTALPLWLGDGLASPLFPVVSIAMMLTPAIAAILVVTLVERPEHRLGALGIRPIGPVPRFIGFLALALAIPIVLIVAALLVGSLFGVYHADLVDFSGFSAVLDAQLSAAGVTELPMPIGVLVAVQCVAVLAGAVINTIPALGEELGWPGWLLPRLMPLGAVPAIVISGVIWGAWHAPLILLGYNYPTAPGWLGVVMMIGMCTLVGGVFGWLRLRSGSVWPAALAHGSFNAAAGLSLVFAAATPAIDTTQATILGWTGWIVPLALVIVLVSTGQFRPRTQVATTTVA